VVWNVGMGEPDGKKIAFIAIDGGLTGLGA
jgi:hypothetical protein